MKTSALIKILEDIKQTNGDVEVFVHEEDGLKRLGCVTTEGREHFELNGIDIKEKTGIII